VEFPNTNWLGAYEKADHLTSRWRIDGKTLARFPRLSFSVENCEDILKGNGFIAN
jgi:hypothetical protein